MGAQYGWNDPYSKHKKGQIEKETWPNFAIKCLWLGFGLGTLTLPNPNPNPNHYPTPALTLTP